MLVIEPTLSKRDCICRCRAHDMVRLLRKCLKGVKVYLSACKPILQRWNAVSKLLGTHQFHIFFLENSLFPFLTQAHKSSITWLFSKIFPISPFHGSISQSFRYNSKEKLKLMMKWSWWCNRPSTLFLLSCASFSSCCRCRMYLAMTELSCGSIGSATSSAMLATATTKTTRNIIKQRDEMRWNQ